MSVPGEDPVDININPDNPPADPKAAPKAAPKADPPTNNEDQEIEEKVTDLKRHRKQLKSKFTRSINRVQSNIRKGESNFRGLTRELKQIKSDYEQCSFVNGEIYDCTESPAERQRLDTWESELNNDYFTIEDIVNEHLKILKTPTVEQTQPLSPDQTNLASTNEETSSVSVSEIPPVDPLPENPSAQSTSDKGNPSLKVSANGKTVDSWINELREFEETVINESDATSSNLSMSELLYRLEGNRDIPIIKIDAFHGDPEHYIEFVQRFKVHVHDKRHLTDEIRLTQLKMHLTGDAKKALLGIGLSGNMYATALKTLKDQFGDPCRIARTYVNKLTKGTRIFDKFGLKELSINMINSIANLKLLNNFNDMNSSDTLIQIIERLPKHVIDKWRTKCATIRANNERPSIYHLDTFIRAIVKAEFDPDFGDIKCAGFTTRSNHPPPYKKSVNATSPMHKDTSSNSSQKSFYIKPCSLCKGNHKLRECDRFKDLNIKDKFEHVTTNHLCFSCLAAGHNIFRCNRQNVCGINNCPRYHHTLLHSDPLVTSTVLDSRGILPVVRVLFKAHNGRVIRGNVLIDSGSGTTTIRTAFSKALGLQGRRERIDIVAVGGHQFSQSHSRRVSFKISALNGAEEFNIEAHELDTTILDVPELDREYLNSFEHLRGINYSQTSGPIDLILGVQYSHLHADIDARQGRPYEPLAKRSLLGWYVIGPAKSMSSQMSPISICHVDAINFAKFYEFESLGVKAIDCKCPKVQMSREDKQALDLFESTCHKRGDRYEIGLPWRNDPNQLPNNYQCAERRLISLEHSLGRDKAKAELYNQVMEDYVTNKWSHKLTPSEIQQPVKPVHYLPHHGVYRPDKISTPLRIVFDPAHKSGGVSLNSFLFKGPCLIGNLYAILLRFREEPFGIVGDISKMFLQVLLPEHDSQVHRYLWRNLDVSKKPDVYRLLRVTFGDKSSPDMASYVMHKIAAEYKSEYPQAASILENDRYMDDLIHSTATENEARQRMDEVDKLLESGKFKVKEWYCSSRSSNSSTYDVNLDGEDDLKTLGLGWNPVKDILKFTVKPVFIKVFTKRVVLSKMSTLFDPLGLANPVTVKMRMAMQDVWRNKDLDWDDKLPEEDCRIWSTLFEEMYCLNTLSFPRCVKPLDAYGQSELHVFCDASSKAFGAVIFMVWSTTSGREVQLVTSKVRVSPMRQSTIPRLELMGALVGCRLAKTVVDELRSKPGQVIIWLDSHVVLHWLKSESVNMKPFVGVRVTEIQSTWEASTFKYVPTALNPADDLSRGITVDKMEKFANGPQFLKSQPSEWPTEPISHLVVEESEIRKVKPLFVTVKSTPLVEPENFSNYDKLIRVTAYCKRFLNNLQSSRSLNSLRQIGPLTKEEMDIAEDYWIQTAQSSLINWENSFRDLNPYVQKGIIRVGGRLRHTELSYDQRHPILLPRDNHITTLVIRAMHQKVGHAGAERTLAEIRRKFWIGQGRRAVKKVVKECVVCRKLRQPPSETLMGDLPANRLKPLCPPFTTTGVDLFGPFWLKYGRNKSIKAWGAIFTCSTTRALHLEIVQDLSTQAFMFALRRFAATHGWPKTFISDNGTNFIGAEKELSKLFKEGRKKIEDFVVLHKVSWKFITPLSPHQGGFYESLIKQVKKNIKLVVGQQILSWNEMSTVFLEVSNLVNSRPLGYLPDSPNDPQPITPNHFVLGRATTEVPSGPFEQTKDLRKRFLFVQSLVSQFWKRFIREYIPTLQKRSKWITQGRQMEIGDIVLLIETTTPRGKWNLARVVDVYPGQDGIIRNVLVKNQFGEYKRSIQKCVLILES